MRGESAVEFTYGPLEVSDKGAVFECNDTAGNSEAADLILLSTRRVHVYSQDSICIHTNFSMHESLQAYMYHIATNFRGGVHFVIANAHSWAFPLVSHMHGCNSYVKCIVVSI